jgi:hypothetical protein
MRTATLSRMLPIFVFTATINASMYITSTDLATLLPSTPPSTDEPDGWRCAIANISQYFDLPTPAGDLNTVLISYGSVLQQTCTSTGKDRRSCPFPDSSLWCGFSTAAPSTILDAYSSYGSTCSSWWSNHSSAAFSLAQNCPVGWYKAAQGRLVGCCGRYYESTVVVVNISARILHKNR